MQYPWRPDEGIKSPGTGVTDGCQLPRECWESNLSPLKGELVPLATAPPRHTLSPLTFCEDRTLGKTLRSICLMARHPWLTAFLSQMFLDFVVYLKSCFVLLSLIVGGKGCVHVLCVSLRPFEERQ